MIDRGLLDTSTVILLDRIADPSSLPMHPVISSITLAELAVGPFIAATDQERTVRLGHLLRAESDFTAIPFDEEAARMFGRVAAGLRQAGRKASARTYDALIAAVALAHDLPLYTCNPDDFQGIEGLIVVAVPHPDRVA